MTRKTKRQGREKAHQAQLIKLIEREREREKTTNKNLIEVCW
jgi:hypothetical protein